MICRRGEILVLNYMRCVWMNQNEIDSIQSVADAAIDAKTTGALHQVSSGAVKTCLPSGQVIPFPQNCFALMTSSGAKGSMVNFSQISVLLGQQASLNIPHKHTHTHTYIYMRLSRGREIIMAFFGHVRHSGVGRSACSSHGLWKVSPMLSSV